MSASIDLLAARVRHGWREIGVAGRVGLLCVVAANALLALAQWQMQPAIARDADRAAQAQWDAARLLTARQRARPDQRSVDAFAASLPPSALLAEVIDAIHGTADRRQLQIERGDYRVVRELGGLGQRHVLQLPVKGAYADLHRWLEAVLQAHAFVALDEIEIRAAEGDDATVRARVQFSVYSGAAR